MRALSLVLALLLPACRGTGAEGIAPPAPIDMARLVRPGSPNTALAAPAGFAPAPDIVTRRYDATPDRLFAVLQSVALSQPRIYAHGRFSDRRQVHFVARSRLLNYPDLVTAQVTPESDLILWSRSIYGRSDFGVNRKRLEEWLAALDVALLSP